MKSTSGTNLKKKRSEHPRQGAAEKEWRSYSGTGIIADKGKNSIALRRSLDGKKFAIVMRFGEAHDDMPLRILKEIETSDLEEAKKQFRAMAKRRGFKLQ